MTRLTNWKTIFAILIVSLVACNKGGNENPPAQQAPEVQSPDDFGPTPSGADKFVLNEESGCLLRSGKIKCWGNLGGLYFSLEQWPANAPIKTFASNQSNLCLVLSSKPLNSYQWVRCLGDSAHALTTTPSSFDAQPHLITLGLRHACAADTASVQCWGDFSVGQKNVPARLKTPSVLVAGEFHTCAIQNGEVFCWGHNDKGQSSVPALPQARALAAGRAHSCAIVAQGRVRCWGDNSFNQLMVPETLTGAELITAGTNHTCAATKSEVVCWGDSSEGQTSAPSGLSDVRSLTANSTHTCAVLDRGIACWGAESNTKVRYQAFKGADDLTVMDWGRVNCARTGRSLHCKDELGLDIKKIGELSFVNGRIDDVDFVSTNDDTICVSTSTATHCTGPVVGSPKKDFGRVREIAIGHYFICGINHLSQTRCWKAEYYSDFKVPELKEPRSIVASNHFACAITLDGVKCWNPTSSQTKPLVLPSLKNPTKLYAHGTWFCAETDDGLQCWHQTDANLKIQFPPGKVYQQVEIYSLSGYSDGGPEGFVCTLSDGQVDCRGSNDNGGAPTPTDLGYVQQLAVGGRAVCALTRDQDVRCWRRVGDEPVSIPSDLVGIKKLVAATFNFCGLTDAGMRCWDRRLPKWRAMDFPDSWRAKEYLP